MSPVVKKLASVFLLLFVTVSMVALSIMPVCGDTIIHADEIGEPKDNDVDSDDRLLLVMVLIGIGLLIMCSSIAVGVNSHSKNRESKNSNAQLDDRDNATSGLFGKSASTELPTSIPSICPKCGARILPSSKMCSSCGMVFSKPTVSTPPAVTSFNPEKEWRCSFCGCVNQNYVGTCACGTRKNARLNEENIVSENSDNRSQPISSISIVVEKTANSETPLSATEGESLEFVFCGECGAKQSSSKKFCYRCGAVLEHTT